jgi:hypothetical protein
MDEQQDWIAKYRAALDSPPIRESRGAPFARGLKAIIQKLVSAICNASPNETVARSDREASEKLPQPTAAETIASAQDPQAPSDTSHQEAPAKQTSLGEERPRVAR